jgi:hypothetical protein
MIASVLSFAGLSLNVARGGRVKSSGYRAWEKAADTCKLGDIVKLRGEVVAVYIFGLPDRRRRDAANLEKAPRDTMSRWGVLEDDSQIKNRLGRKTVLGLREGQDSDRGVTALKLGAQIAERLRSLMELDFNPA